MSAFWRQVDMKMSVRLWGGLGEIQELKKERKSGHPVRDAS